MKFKDCFFIHIDPVCTLKCTQSGEPKQDTMLILLFFCLFFFQILKSESLAAGEEEDAGWIFFYLV